jgi:serine phosphatase RsbU (regulator of sigma subunit)/tetratricopeptide (TPR) repeat protein
MVLKFYLKNTFLIFFFTYMIICLNAFAQQTKFDSLKRLLPNKTTSEKKAILLIEIAKSIYNSIPDSSIGYCEQAEILSKTNNLEVQLAHSLHCECRYLLLKGDVKTTINKLNQAIVLFEKNSEQKGLAKCYSLKSIALSRIDKNNEALDYLIKAKNIYTVLNDTLGLATVLQNLANQYSDVGNYNEAIKSLEAIKNINLKKNDLDFYTEINYGSIYFKQKQINNAIIHYKKASEIAHEYKMLDSEITALTHIAECYLELTNYNESRVYFQNALALAVEHHLLVEEKDALLGILKLCEMDKNYTASFFTLKRIKKIEDSLFNIEKIKSINNIEHKLEITEKEKIIAEQDLSIEKEKANTFVLIGGLVFVILAFTFLFFYNQRTKKLVTQIEIQKKEVELQKEIIEIKNKDVMDSIHYAKYIQGSMLPSDKTMDLSFPENFVLYKPKDIVAGDFYWTETINNNPALAVCDCTGHGVPGAMVSIVACNALNRAVKEFKLTNPAHIFDKVNELMQETFSQSDYDVNDGMDGTLCVFDYPNMKLHIAAANNPIYIITPPSIKTEFWDAPWQFSQISPDKRPIGRFKDEVSPFELKTISVQKGEMIYLLSDGFADQFGGPKGKKFKYKQLQELLISVADKPSSTQKEELTKTLNAWKGPLDQVDDILIIGIRI